MYRTIALAMGLAFGLSSPCSAAMTLLGGDHVFYSSGQSTFPIIATSDADDTILGIDLFLVMDLDGPLVTKVDLIHGTVFESKTMVSSTSVFHSIRRQDANRHMSRPRIRERYRQELSP